MGRKVLTCLLLLLPLVPGVCQSRADTSFLNAARNNAVALYEQALRSQSRIYNGSKYVAPEHTLEQHPFFSSVDWLVGAAFYDGEYFENIALMYDLQTGALITEHLPSGHPIQLVREKVKYFSIGGHYFERIENDSVSNSLPRSGFYDILYQGETRVVARRQKLMREQIIASVIERSFDERTRHFLYKNGVYFPLKGKSSLLKVLADKKTELKRFIKQNRLRLSSDREVLFKSVAEFYDTLK
jgi:hypothetical protein